MATTQSSTIDESKENLDRHAPAALAMTMWLSSVSN